MGILSIFSSCSGEKDVDDRNSNDRKDENIILEIPNVVEDSIYHFVEKQVAFGPRVPGSKAHAACAKWLESKFNNYGAKVTLQKFKADFHFGGSAECRLRSCSLKCKLWMPYDHTCPEVCH